MPCLLVPKIKAKAERSPKADAGAAADAEVTKAKARKDAGAARERGRGRGRGRKQGSINEDMYNSDPHLNRAQQSIDPIGAWNHRRLSAHFSRR